MVELPFTRPAESCGPGDILLAEHVRSPNRFVRVIHRPLDPLPHRLGGDHLLREPLEPLVEAGFEAG